MPKTVFSRIAAALCLVGTAGTILAGCGSKSAVSSAPAVPAAVSGPAPAVGTPSGNPVGDAYRDGIVAAHQHH